jgi:hypothetical protein
MLRQEWSMRRAGRPGIVAFELVGSVARAEEILRAWGPEGQTAAGQVGGRRRRDPVPRRARDAGENTALLAILAGRRARAPRTATTMALTKFCFLGLGIVYTAAGSLAARRLPGLR